jgi:salicylate hydroxylase
MTQPILIIGGGIGGLTAAVALARQGFKVRVFEQAKAIGDVGAGISLGITASKGLYSLGLREILRAAADPPQKSTALHYQTGEVLGGAFADRPYEAEDRPFVNQIHRADLFALLKNALERLSPSALDLGHAFERFEQDNEGVTAIFADGSTVRGAALIGCDGVRSNVRAQILGHEEPRFTGRVAYRFLVPMEKAHPYMTVAGSASYVAPRKSLLRYPVRHGRLVNCVAFVHSDSGMGESWSQRVTSEELMSLFEGWHADVQGLARAAPLDGTAKWGIYDRDPLPEWTQGRVTLLGDAAHPMLPFLGLGAAMAIEDAVILARSCQALPDIPAALSLYEKARSGRAGDILLASRHQADIFSDGPGGTRRPILTKSQRMDYDPSTVPLQ